MFLDDSYQRSLEVLTPNVKFLLGFNNLPVDFLLISVPTFESPDRCHQHLLVASENA